MLDENAIAIKIPQSYFCSITNQIMVEPVFIEDGFTYEREAIEEWLKTNDTSPKTRQVLSHKQLLPNWDKKGDITEFLDKHPQLYESDEVYLPNAWKKQLVNLIKNNQIMAVQECLVKDSRLLTFPLEKHYTAFYLACQFGSSELSQMILEKVCKSNCLSEIKTPPSHFRPLYLNKLLEQSLEEKDKDKFLLLLSLGADLIQVENETGNTLLHRLVLKNLLGPIIWMKEQDVSLENDNLQGNTPLLLSLLHYRLEVTELLLKMGANPYAQNKQQKTALSLAVENGNLRVARLLLDKNTQFVVMKKTQEENLFHLALRYNDLPMLELLLQTQGITLLNSFNKKGDTPLHLATKLKQEGSIALLLKAGADHKLKNSKQQTPLEIAKDKNDLKTVNLILKTVRIIKQAKWQEMEMRIKQQSDRIEQLEITLKEQAVQYQMERQQLQLKLEQAKEVIITQFNQFRKVKKSTEQTKNPLIKTIPFKSTVHSLQVLPDNRLAVAGNCRSIDIYDLTTGSSIGSLKGHAGYVFCLKLSVKGELISGSRDGIIKIWNTVNSQCVKTFSGHSGVIYCLQVLPSGELIMGSEDNTIKVWDLTNEHCLKTLVGHTSMVSCLQLLPSGELISGSFDGTIRMWDLASGDCIKILKNSGSIVSCLQLLSSGELVSGDYGEKSGNIKIWDLISGNCLKTLYVERGVCSGQMLPSGELISMEVGNKIKIWDLKSGNHQIVYQGEKGLWHYSNYGMQLLPNGNLITGFKVNGGIPLWDLSEFTKTHAVEKKFADCRIS